MQYRSLLPYKSVAVALILSTLLGPLGLLYASWWGGVILIPVALFLIANRLFYILLMIWLVSCILSVRAIERYNFRLIRIYNSAPDYVK